MGALTLQISERLNSVTMSKACQREVRYQGGYGKMSSIFTDEFASLQPNQAQETTFIIDEDNSNHSFENLIPLSSKLNNAIERYRSPRNIADDDLRIEALDLRARKKYNAGQFQHAYGCNRLA